MFSGRTFKVTEKLATPKKFVLPEKIIKIKFKTALSQSYSTARSGMMSYYNPCNVTRKFIVD